MILRDGAINFVNAIKALLETKQDKLTGEEGQVVGFDAEGNPVAQEAPEGGVTSFNGRTGAITPQTGDYTAAQVGALSTAGGTLNGNVTLGSVSNSVKITAAYQENHFISSFNPSDPSILRLNVGKQSNRGGMSFSMSSTDITEENSTFVSGVRTPVNEHEAANKKYVDAAVSANAGGVTSFNGRTGAITPQSGDYTATQVGALALSGGTLTGNLTIKNGSSNFGSKINLGDGDYVHISEPTDDCLEIKATKINFVVSTATENLATRFTLNGTSLETGGTATSAETANKLATARTIWVNVGSNAIASFDGSANVTPGVYGTLPIANGGTGVSSIVSTNYTSTLYRGISFLTSTPTAVSNGCISLVYS